MTFKNFTDTLEFLLFLFTLTFGSLLLFESITEIKTPISGLIFNSETSEHKEAAREFFRISIAILTLSISVFLGIDLLKKRSSVQTS